jgi:hypothetical protein
MKIERIENVQAALRKAGQKYGKSTSVIVGYTARYALYVHERVEMKWRGLPRGAGMSKDKSGIVRYSKGSMHTGPAFTKTGKVKKIRGKPGYAKGFRGFYWDPIPRAQAKFLEQPYRENRDKLAAMIRDGLSNKLTLLQSLLRAGIYLQRLSQEICPVDTGNLKASAFTRRDR